MEREHLTERRGTAWRVGGRFDEGERPEETDGGIEKGQDVGPGNIGRRVGCSSRVEESAGAEFDAIRSGGSEAMPKQPPTTSWVWKGGIVRVGAEEVAVVVAIRNTIRGSGEGLR
jgi:hypothetical protein